MKRKLTWMMVGILLLLLVTTTVYAAGEGTLSIPWWSVDNGGGSSQSSDGRFKLNGAIGQPDAAQSQFDDLKLSGGFWGGGAPPLRKLYFPKISRQ